MLEAKSWKEGDISCDQSFETNDSEMMDGSQPWDLVIWPNAYSIIRVR